MKKKQKKEIAEIIFIILGLLAVFVAILCAISIVMPVERKSEATKYNLGCVAGRSRRPLVECKE